jgi:hypothetical protein
MSDDRCPTCAGPTYRPYYPPIDPADPESRPTPRYFAYGGAAAVAAEVEGVREREDRNDPSPYGWGGQAGIRAFALEGDDWFRGKRVKVPPAFFSLGRLKRLVGEERAADILASLEALIAAVTLTIITGEPCPTCAGPSFVRDGGYYALRGDDTVRAAARALYHLPSGRAARDQGIPFFSETFLYRRLGKEDARTVLARIHNLIRTANIENVWQFDRGGW